MARPWVLGLSTSFHDGAACLFRRPRHDICIAEMAVGPNQRLANRIFTLEERLGATITCMRDASDFAALVACERVVQPLEARP